MLQSHGPVNLPLKQVPVCPVMMIVTRGEMEISLSPLSSLAVMCSALPNASVPLSLLLRFLRFLSTVQAIKFLEGEVQQSAYPNSKLQFLTTLLNLVLPRILESFWVIDGALEARNIRVNIWARSTLTSP